MENRAERADRFYKLAEIQQGYFTSADAKKFGYDYPHQHFHVKQGNWIRVDHGIYRLKKFPSTEHQDLIRWWLWSRKKGVISYDTAAAVYELGDLLHSKVHLTVPPNFRRKPAKGLVLHKADVDESETERRNGFPITKPLRTIMDLARSRTDPEKLSLAAKDAIRKGLMERRALLDLLSKMPAGIDLPTNASLQLAIGEGGPGVHYYPPAVEEMPQVREASTRKTEPRLNIQDVLTELNSGFQSMYGKRLKGVYLFGSYARGEAESESDLDILVVLDDFDRYAREVDRASELASDLSLKYGVSVSLVFVRECEWRHGDTPFLANVREEAILA